MRLLLGLWLMAVTLLADAHIFVYHRFGDTRYPSTNTSIEILKKQFDYFKKNGYRVVPLKDLVKRVKEGKTIPDNWVVLTIDDGYRSFYENALPLFKEYRYPFTLFIYTGATENGYRDYMSWDQIKDTMGYGEIGLHSHTHPHMVSKSDNYLKEDFEKGLKLIQNRLGIKVAYFAYPYGEYDQRVKKIAENFGFEAIFNQNLGAVSNESDLLDLDRIALTGDPNLKQKLRVNFLKANWIEPQKWPKNSIIGRVHMTVFDHSAKKGWLYLTGYGWKRIELRNGELDTFLNLPLKNRRSRLILKLEKDRISTKIVVKP